ncbi:MAG: hypothetical protein U0237_03510 [Thermoleophilia bacterium]
MTIRRVVLAVLLSLLAVVAGCGSDRTGPAAAAAGDEVVLLKAGTDPQPLRLRLFEGAVSRARITMRFQLGQTVDGQDAGLPRQPGQRFTIEATTTDVSGGVATISYRYPTVEVVDTDGVDPVLLARLRDLTRPFTDINGVIRIDDRGRVLSSTIDGIDGLDASLRPLMQQLTDQLKSLSVPLPEEPVGIGGSWRGSFSVDVGGVRTDTAYTYTLDRRDGERLEISSRAVSTAHVGTSQSTSPGVEIEQVTGGSTVTGGNVMDLGRFLPLSSTGRVDGTVTMDVRAGSQRSDVEVRTSGTIELDSGG